MPNPTSENSQIFGKEIIIDLHGCNPEKIRSGEAIRDYSDKLIKLIDMKKYGELFLEHFAEHSKIAAGFSFAQMIETSLVSGHFSEYLNSAYINIFSCKDFDEKKAAEFTKEFFEAEELISRVIVRK